MSTVADLSERDLIARVRTRLAATPAWVLVGVGDDAAVVRYERNQVEVLTVDAVVEGIHFDRAFTPADAIGHRALAVNLSDIAAMGAAPRLALLSMMLPGTLAVADFDAVLDGLFALANEHRIHVVGGNLTRSPGPLVVDVTAMGTARRRQVLTRAGARPGDEIYVTGAVGAAAAGLQALRARRASSPAIEAAVRAYLYPQPRVRAGLLAGRARAASACMDLSDGLLDAVRQVSEASGVGIALEQSLVPIASGAREWWQDGGSDLFIEAASGGDDYELLFAVPRRRRRSFLAAMTHSGTAITRIGSCTEDPGVRIDGHSVETVFPAGFRHFR